MNLKDILTANKAIQEFSMMAQSIKPIMTDPEVTRAEKRKTLCSLVDKLSDSTLNNDFVAGMIMKIINMKEDVCKEYPDAESQVSGILEWLPRMKVHRGKLLDEVVKHRREYRLNI